MNTDSDFDLCSSSSSSHEAVSTNGGEEDTDEQVVFLKIRLPFFSQVELRLAN